MKKSWTEKEITGFAINRTEPQRLLNVLLGLIGPSGNMPAARSPGTQCGLTIGLNKHADFYTFAAHDDVSNG
jgi:hypothetical protein